MAMSGQKKKRSYVAPQIRTQAMQTQSVLLACSDPLAFDCDAAYGLGYQCCQPDEASCQNC